MLKIDKTTLENDLAHLDLPAVRLTLTYPVVTFADDRASRRINVFYARLANVIAKHTERTLLQLAARAMDDALAASRGFEPWRVKLSFAVESPRATDYDGTEDCADAHEAPTPPETLTITHTLYVRVGGEERERCFATVWEERSGLILRTSDFAPTY